MEGSIYCQECRTVYSNQSFSQIDLRPEDWSDDHFSLVPTGISFWLLQSDND